MAQAASEPDDRELIARHAGGDPWAFERLVRRHWSDLVKLAGRWLGPEGAEFAEDAVLQAFVVLHRELARWRHEAEPRTWLYRTVLNVCANHLRSLRRRRRVSERLRPAGRDCTDLPGDGIQRSEESQRLRRALADLPDRGRAVVILFHFHGLSARQIGGILGASASTVRRALRVSLDRLKNLMCR